MADLILCYHKYVDEAVKKSADAVEILNEKADGMVLSSGLNSSEIELHSFVNGTYI